MLLIKSTIKKYLKNEDFFEKKKKKEVKIVREVYCLCARRLATSIIASARSFF